MAKRAPVRRRPRKAWPGTRGLTPAECRLEQHEGLPRKGRTLSRRLGVAWWVKERGLVSPYPRSFVVARINPLRWIKGDPPPLEDVLKTMRERVAKFNVEKIRPQDLAGATGPPDEEP